MTVDGTGIMEKIGVAEVEIEYKTNGVWRYYDSLRNIPSFTNITRETLWERPTFKELQVSAIV